jgi:hypothetical protein
LLKSVAVTLFTWASVVCADMIVAASSSKGLLKCSAVWGLGYSFFSLVMIVDSFFLFSMLTPLSPAMLRQALFDRACDIIPVIIHTKEVCTWLKLNCLILKNLRS